VLNTALALLRAGAGHGRADRGKAADRKARAGLSSAISVVAGPTFCTAAMIFPASPESCKSGRMG